MIVILLPEDPAVMVVEEDRVEVMVDPLKEDPTEEDPTEEGQRNPEETENVLIVMMMMRTIILVMITVNKL